MENERIRNYFLGRLDSAETESFELEIILNPSIEPELLIAETDLIEDFLDEALEPSDTSAFEQNYLTTPERQAQVKLIRQLRNYSPPEPSVEKNPNFFERLRTAFVWRPLNVAAAAIILVLIIAIGWQFIISPKQNGTETELVAINRQDLSNLADFKDLMNLSLSAGKVRSDDSLRSIDSDNIKELLFVRLALPAKIESDQTFKVKISKDGKVLQDLKQISYLSQEVRLLLPKSILDRGEYQITLENGTEIYNYFFLIR